MFISTKLRCCFCMYIGIVNKILSWNSLLPLSRLTYGVYLVHYVLQDIQTLRTKSDVTTDTFSVVSSSEDHPPRGSAPAWHAGNPPLFLAFIISRARFSLPYLHPFLNQSLSHLIGTNKTKIEYVCIYNMFL